MKKFGIYLMFCLMTFSAAYLYAAPGFQAFFLGQPIPLHPVVIHDTVYLPIAEVAKLFHLKVDVDLGSGHILLEPETPSSFVPSQNPTDTQEDVILGQIETELNRNVRKPILNVKIHLFKSNARYAEAVDRHALELWIANGNPFYVDTHGKVADTVSDPDGRFAFVKVPPGLYELVATYPISSREIGFWRIPIDLTKGEVKEVKLTPANLTRISLK